MKRYQQNAGQFVQWFRFNKDATTSDPIYDVGPLRAWYPAITLPVLLGEYKRANKNFDDDGLFPVDTATLIFSYNTFFHTGMPDPDPTFENHLNDRFAFDGSLFSAASFFPQGRVADYFLTVSVNAIQVSAAEMAEDGSIPIFSGYVLAPDSTVI